MAGVAAAAGVMAVGDMAVGDMAAVGVAVAGVAAGIAAGADRAFMAAGVRAFTAAPFFTVADALCAAGCQPHGAGECAGSIAASEQKNPLLFD